MVVLPHDVPAEIGKDLAARWAPWAEDQDVALLPDFAKCPHGLYGLTSCPTQGTAASLCDGRRLLDHARWWLPADGRPFLLAHVYNADERTLPAARTLAAQHGLEVRSTEWDGWYGFGTTALRFEFGGGAWDYTMPPLEVALLAHRSWKRAKDQAAAAEERTRHLGWRYL